MSNFEIEESIPMCDGTAGQFWSFINGNVPPLVLNCTIIIYTYKQFIFALFNMQDSGI